MKRTLNNIGAVNLVSSESLEDVLEVMNDDRGEIIDKFNNIKKYYTDNGIIRDAMYKKYENNFKKWRTRLDKLIQEIQVNHRIKKDEERQKRLLRDFSVKKNKNKRYKKLSGGNKLEELKYKYIESLDSLVETMNRIDTLFNDVENPIQHSEQLNDLLNIMYLHQSDIADNFHNIKEYYTNNGIRHDANYEKYENNFKKWRTAIDAYIQGIQVRYRIKKDEERQKRLLRDFSVKKNKNKRCKKLSGGDKLEELKYKYIESINSFIENIDRLDREDSTQYSEQLKDILNIMHLHRSDIADNFHNIKEYYTDNGMIHDENYKLCENNFKKWRTAIDKIIQETQVNYRIKKDEDRLLRDFSVKKKKLIL